MHDSAQTRVHLPEPADISNAMASSTGDGDDVCAAARGVIATVSLATLMKSEDDMNVDDLRTVAEAWGA
jgi:hypothetical protein